MQKFIEGPVKLREAGKSTLKGNVRDGIISGQKQCLGIAHSGHLYIVSEGKTRHLLKLMR